MKPWNHTSGWRVVAVVCLLTVSAVVSRSGSAQKDAPLNVQLTTQAWNALGKGDYNQAIEHANKCIDEFRGQASRAEAALEKEQAPLPPTGAVSAAEKKKIFARGLLNDVATCYFIKGRAAENLGRKEEAKAAYQAALKYKYARCWDPKGWFWSVADAASDRLDGLK